MNIFGIICLMLVVLAFISLFIYLINYYEEKSEIAIGCFIGFLSSAFIVILIVSIEKPIQAIEVYRGNTELQITYQDSISIDSVVVYKNN